MRRILIAVFVILVAWIALKDWAYSAILGEADITPEAPDYFYDDVWLERPEEQPPGGWKEPWGVDLLVIAPPVSSPARKGLVPAGSELLEQDYTRFMEATGLAGAEMTIYAPGYRSPSPGASENARKKQLLQSQTDLKAALKRYMSADNRVRGLVILAAPDTQPLAESLLKALPEDADFRDRFGGVVLSAGESAEEWEPVIQSCSPAFESCVMESGIVGTPQALAWLLPSQPYKKRTYRIDGDATKAIETRMESLSNWLDLNATKPAEPFDSWAADEVVDVVPIIRPNGEEDISGERGD
ncbi:hypothetical protein [Henriciella aquimarina]|uniref:hypothetical protein n=1 Tax=Henriciella aquimarina TaxID=545261 RepID=UPI0009FFFC78|nr:hypothetical protein [Henriciella aquimarina]